MCVCVCVCNQKETEEKAHPPMEDRGTQSPVPTAERGHGPRRSRRCPRRVPAVPVPGAGAGGGRAVSLPGCWSPGSRLTPSLPGGSS